MVIAMYGCGDSGEVEPRQKLTGFILRVKAENKLSTGEIKLEETSGNFLRIWKAEGKSFDSFNKPVEDSKYLYDSNSKTSFEYDHLVTGGTMSKEIDPGRYYFHIQTGQDGRLNYTAGYVEIEKENDLVVYEIIVPANGISYSWFDWNPIEKE